LKVEPREGSKVGVVDRANKIQDNVYCTIMLSTLKRFLWSVERADTLRSIGHTDGMKVHSIGVLPGSSGLS